MAGRTVVAFQRPFFVGLSDSDQMDAAEYAGDPNRRVNGAGEGNRTLTKSLGSSRSTIELHPQNQQLPCLKPTRLRSVVRLLLLVESIAT